MKKIVYVVGNVYMLNGMSVILTRKINYLAEHTDWQLYMILTERPDLPWVYEMSPKVKWVNFNIGFDELDTMPLFKKLYYYIKKQRVYKRKFTKYLMEVRPDITVSALRREINFLNDINDDSIKIGEFHFNKQNYRKINKRYFPVFLNKWISDRWSKSLEDEVKKLDKFIVLTEADRKQWKGIQNIQVIPNFLESIPKESSALTNKRVIAVGRYEYQKGFDLLIPAWKEVVASHPDWTLEIFGAGDSSAYERIAQENGVADYVHCNLATPNINKEYLESSIFVLSSRFEGFGMVLIEAMSCGLPCVSFDCPCGPSDIIQDGMDGILVPNGDIQALAKSINRLIDDKELMRSLAVRAKESARRYSKDEIMSKWLQLFQQVMTSR